MSLDLSISLSSDRRLVLIYSASTKQAGGEEDDQAFKTDSQELNYTILLPSDDSSVFKKSQASSLDLIKPAFSAS